MAPPGPRDSRSEGGMADGRAAWARAQGGLVNNTTGPVGEQTAGGQGSHRLALLAALLIAGEALGELRAGVPRVRPGGSEAQSRPLEKAFEPRVRAHRIDARVHSDDGAQHHRPSDPWRRSQAPSAGKRRYSGRAWFP